MLNSTILMGRLTNNPDYRTTASGISVCRFTLAVDRDYSGGDKPRETDFIDVCTWRSTADFVSKYFHKGQLVAVQGSIQTGSYTDRDGVKRRKWEIIANHVYFAESKQTVDARANNSIANNQPDYSASDGYGDLPFN